jgi:hypothetical protein
MLFFTSGSSNHPGVVIFSMSLNTSTGICAIAVSKTDIHLETGIN